MTLDNLVGRGLEKAAADREELARYLEHLIAWLKAKRPDLAPGK